MMTPLPSVPVSGTIGCLHAQLSIAIDIAHHRKLFEGEAVHEPCKSPDYLCIKALSTLMTAAVLPA